MRLIHSMPFSAQETESYRQLVFDNITRGLRLVLDALPDMELALPPAYTRVYPDDDPQRRGGFVEGWAPGEAGGMPLDRAGEGLEQEGVRPDELRVRAPPPCPRPYLADTRARKVDVELLEGAPDVRDGQPFPLHYLGVRPPAPRIS